jgi:hypothetical protein
MSKVGRPSITAIMRSNGTLIGTAQHLDEPSEVQTMVRPMAGYTLHEIDVPDDCRYKTPDELHQRIRSLLPRDHCK